MAVRALLVRAEGDTASAARREDLCGSLATSFREAGDLLWVGGNIIGPDRVTGSSPFGFGNDAAVGLATVIQIAGELTAGAVALLEQANLYGAAALIRQLVEVEYLGAWVANATGPGSSDRGVRFGGHGPGIVASGGG